MSKSVTRRKLIQWGSLPSAERRQRIVEYTSVENWNWIVETFGDLDVDEIYQTMHNLNWDEPYEFAMDLHEELEGE